KVDSQQLIGVVVSDQLLKESLKGTSTLSAVNALASNAGLSAGQTIAEARALCAHLNVIELSQAQVTLALKGAAESLLRFTATISIVDATAEPVRRDHKTVPSNFSLSTCVIWLDITGTAHLFDGEAALCSQVAALLESLGHRVQVAVANGPYLAAALARNCANA